MPEPEKEELIEATIASGEPGQSPREAVPQEDQPHAPDDPNPPERWEQDTQPVEGGVATNLPPGSDLVQRDKVQG